MKLEFNSAEELFNFIRDMMEYSTHESFSDFTQPPEDEYKRRHESIKMVTPVFIQPSPETYHEYAAHKEYSSGTCKKFGGIP